MPKIEVPVVNKDEPSIDGMLETARKSVDVVVREVSELYAIMRAVNDEFSDVLGADAKECIHDSAHELEVAAFWALKAQNMLGLPKSEHRHEK